MLTPASHAKTPLSGGAGLPNPLPSLAVDGAGLSRDAALNAFRRHLARIQAHVQDAFEHEQITGLDAARKLGALIDGLVAALYEHAVAGA